jgi:hypothetical protein
MPAPVAVVNGKTAALQCHINNLNWLCKCVLV